MERVVERVDALIPAQPKALRVCAYARVSTGKDAMLHSLSAQVSYYSKMIQSHNGWMYCGVYSDEACTKLITQMPATDKNGKSSVTSRVSAHD